MVIEISEGAFNVKSLKQILDYLKVCNGQHTVSTEKNTAIMKLLDGVPHYLELYKELVVKSENGISFSNSIEVVVDSPSLGQIAVNDLYNFLKKSAVLVLENEHSDRDFIETVLTSLNAKRLLECLNSYWEIRGAGGCGEIPKLVEATVNASHSSRVTVVHDSDKLFSAAGLDRAQVNIVNKCNEKKVTFVTLKKREIENYIVDEVLGDIKTLTCSTRNAVVNLTSIQKDYFDYKEGFKSRKPADYSGLFHNLDNDSLLLLQNGLGNNISEIAYSSEFRRHFSEENIDNRCTEILPEFRKIESNILKML